MSGSVACKGVFLIVGNSFCGSTLLNVLLGAHPQIAGGGELHWLSHASAAERAKEGRCVFCRDDCRIWTQATRAEVTVDNIYDVTSRAFGRSFVCDASKMPDWSIQMASHTHSPRIRILMAKHPLRHVASFLEKARREPHMGNLSTIDQVLTHLALVNQEARAEPVDFVLRYEDLVNDPRAAITPILAKFGLDFDPGMEAWRTADHHHIGGNAGPRSQIAPTNRPSGDFLWRKYHRGDIFVDDSFAAVLTSEEIETVLAHPLAKAMFTEFGYEPRIEPSGDGVPHSMDLAAGEKSLRDRPALLPMPFEPYGGYCFLSRVKLMPQHLFIKNVANNESDLQRSPFVLLEDGRAIGPAHTLGNLIRSEGGGRFGHWKDVFIFSTSDNSDPNTNGRAYSIQITASPSLRIVDGGTKGTSRMSESRSTNQ